MPSCLGPSQNGPFRLRLSRGLLRILFGLIFTALLISLSFHLPSIRQFHQGSTSFTPLAAILTSLLSPFWILIHLLILHYFNWLGRSVISILVPTILIAMLCLHLIRNIHNFFHSWDY